MPTADVGDCGEATEVIGGDHGRNRELGHTRHGLVEDLGEFRLVGEVFECGLAAQLGDHRGPRPHRVGQMAPVFAVLGRANPSRHAGQRDRGVGAQRVGECSELIPAVAALPENSDSDQRTKHSLQRICIGIHPPRQLGTRGRSIGKRVGDTQISCSSDCLGNPRAHEQFHHHGRRWGCALMSPGQVVARSFEGSCDLRRWDFGGRHGASLLGRSPSSAADRT